MGISVTEHLLVNKVLTLDSFIETGEAIRLYYELSEKAQFISSKVSDHRGAVEATTDTAYTEIEHNGRISETAYQFSFADSTVQALAKIAQDAADILGVSTKQMEPWQCTRYFTGGKFDYHDDCGNWASNERLYTIMLTVRAPQFGGGTHFPRLNKTFDSRAARLLIWRNLDEDFLCDGQAQHAGLPVGQLGTEDEKMILVTWVRRFDYVS